MTTALRMQPDDRRDRILDAAMSVAIRSGYRAMTRDDVAEEAGVSAGLITRYFYHMDLLRAEVVAAAVERGVLSLVAEGLVAGEPAAVNAPLEVRTRAALELLV